MSLLNQGNHPNPRASHYTALLLAATLIISGCTSTDGPASASSAIDENTAVEEMQIVDCLLPGQLRKLGNMSYLSPRRPVKTTASDCRIRGGEYVAYDRADYKTALKVWLPAAEEGDAEAQVYVGEIFEKGLGTEPNYQAAALWYDKAAKQGNKRGLFNIGTLYEQGLGVPQDKLKALNYYRLAWGLPADSLMYQATAQREQAELKRALEEQLATKNSQLSALEAQLGSLQTQLAAANAGSKSDAAATAKVQLAALGDLVGSLRNERNDVAQRLSTIPKLRAPGEFKSAAKVVSADEMAKEVSAQNMDFGRYYALIIGNRNYSSIESLETPLNDAQEVGELLEEKYGFKVQLLLDADRLTVMRAINEIHDILTENDNLLIYYAGHGSLNSVGARDTGYWLPVNADPPPDDSHWVSNEFVTNHLGRLRAKRVLVIADSCYGGLLSSSPGHLFLGDNANLDLDYLRYKLPRRSRLLLSSGGDKPVIDNGGDQHSVFAEELIQVLRSNENILSAPQLYASVREPVKRRAANNNFIQEPVYKSIKGAGHEVGDFFFVPRNFR